VQKLKAKGVKPTAIAKHPDIRDALLSALWSETGAASLCALLVTMQQADA
jgi:hypothetical protein